MDTIMTSIISHSMDPAKSHHAMWIVLSKQLGRTSEEPDLIDTWTFALVSVVDENSFSTAALFLLWCVEDWCVETGGVLGGGAVDLAARHSAAQQHAQDHSQDHLASDTILRREHAILCQVLIANICDC